METFPQPFGLPFPVDKNALARFPAWEETRKGVWGKWAEVSAANLGNTAGEKLSGKPMETFWKSQKQSLGYSPCPAAQLFQGYFKHYYSCIPVPEYIFYK